MYDLVKNFYKNYPNIRTFMNYTIKYLIQDLEKNNDNYLKIEKEINIILLLYRNDIEIIKGSMHILLIIFLKYMKKKKIRIKKKN